MDDSRRHCVVDDAGRVRGLMDAAAPAARPTLRETLARRSPACGVEVCSASPAAVEIAASLRFDVVVIDALHAPVSPFSGELESLLRAAGAHGGHVLVRSPEGSPGTLNRVLNDGAHGVIVPDVLSAADAVRAVHACRYPPNGRRGAAPVVRSANYGLTPWEDYRAAVNDDTIVLVSVASLETLAAADEILAVEGIDGLIIEALPLAVAVGSPADGGASLDEDATRAAAAPAIAAARACGKLAAAATRSEADALAWRDAGCELVVLADDLAAYAEKVVGLRRELEFLPGTGGQRLGRNLRTRLNDGDVVLGMFSTLVEAPFIEVLGHAGFDFVITDCEESPGDSFGMRLEDLVRAADAAGLATIVRPVENRPGAINRALNAGSHGLFVPHVRSAAECKAVIDAGRYPPAGRRGAAPVVRAARFGLEDWDHYRVRTNDENLLMAMIEDVEAVENIEEIVRTPGLDGVLVGTWDLAVELGCPDYGPPKPVVMEHVSRVIAATLEAGLVMSAHCWSADAAAKYAELGCQILIVSLDSTLFVKGLQALEAVAAGVRGLDRVVPGPARA